MAKLQNIISQMYLILFLSQILLLFLISLNVCWAGEDFYQLLGVERTASTTQISRAYKKLAVKYHPDKVKPEERKEAEAMFQKVSKAYEVLKDDQKRRTYDQFGEEGLEQGGRGGGGFTDPFDLFNFGFGGGRHSGGRPAEQPRGLDLVIDLEVSLKDLYIGRILTVTHRKQVLCPRCRGTGGKNPDDVQTCPVCQGSGVRIQTQRLGPGFITQTQTTCDKCGGKGKIVKETCPACRGSKVSKGEETITIVIERGMLNNQEIVFEQEGDEAPGTTPGNLIFKLTTVPHHKFTRDGNNLRYVGEISLLEALIGFEKFIRHLDGHVVTLKRKEVTKPGFEMVIPGEGMPLHEVPSETGDLFVTFTVKFPTSLTTEQKETIKQVLGEEK